MKKVIFVTCIFLLMNLFLKAQTPITTNQLTVDDGSFISNLTGNNLQFSRSTGPSYIWSENVGGYLSFGTHGRVFQNSNANLVLKPDLNSYFNGKLGIGTTSPQANADITTSSSSMLLPNSTGSTNTSILRVGYNNHSWAGAQLDMGVYNDNATGYPAWIQVRNPTDYSVNRNLLLNPNGGNVGIGTTSPDSNFTVQGNVNVGGTGNYHLKTRHINGKELTSTNIDNLYLNYNTGKHVIVGYGGQDSNIFVSGKIGIGTTDTQGFKLGVNGNIAATEVKVATYANWPDFVFERNYKLPTLKEVEQYIKQKGHLKHIPSAEDVKENGIFLGEMDSKLLRKIEELMLYTIEQEKKLENQKAINSNVEKELKEFHKENEILRNLLDRVQALEIKIKS